MPDSSTGENSPLSPASSFCLYSSLKLDIMVQVHDELVLEVDPSYAKEAAMLLQYSMENAVSLLGMFLLYNPPFYEMYI